jgi:hypothetical protein
MPIFDFYLMVDWSGATCRRRATSSTCCSAESNMTALMVSFPRTSPARLYSREKVLQRPSPVPKKNGLYGWYFDEVPPDVPTDGCLTFNGKTLLYLGIAPDKANKPESGASLYSRILNHYSGNAEGSTLRRSLGVLLAPTSRFPLRRVGAGRRFTLAPAGEEHLDTWMAKNAFVAWTVHPEPWTLEKDLLRIISCPLNIMHNKHHTFVAVLKQRRALALAQARIMDQIAHQ